VDKRGLGAPAFYQDVGDQRRAVNDRLQPARFDAFPLEQISEPFLDSVRWVVRSGQDLVDSLFAGRIVDEDEICERTTDVDTRAMASM
jgi:hypothetical protein